VVGKLRNLLIVFDGRKGHFRFESRCVVPERSSLHGYRQRYRPGDVRRAWLPKPGGGKL
jgi:hypothetical protein